MQYKFLIYMFLLIPLLFSGQSQARVNLFFDDFERVSLGSDWTVVKGDPESEVGIGTFIANSGTRSMYTCCDVVSVTSKAFDLTGLNYVELEFWLRSGSDDYSEWPSSTDDLYLEFLLSDNSWQEVKFYDGGGSSEGDVYNYRAKIPASAYHSNFRFRFRQVNGSGSDHDYWHIDDIAVVDHEVGPVQYPLFYDGFERNLLVSTLDWVVDPVDARFDSEISNHASIAGSKSMYSCCGEMYTTTRNIDLSGESFAEIEFWVKNGDDSLSGTDFFTFGNFDSETPSSGDDIQVEIYLNDGQWHEIDYYYGGASSTAGKERWYRASVPDAGFHNAFKLRFYQIDGSLSSSKRYDLWHIDEVFVGTRDDLAASVDHFRLSYGSAALTCNPHTVTVEACEDAACSSLYTDSVIATLSPTGWVGGDTITFSGGSTSVNLAHTTADTVTLGVSSSTPTVTGSGTLCSIDGGSFSSSCALTFADSGFIVDVPDFLSAKGTAATISAVKTSDATQECTPAFASVSKNIALWSDYVLPASGGLNVSVNGIAIGTTSGSATTQSLAFNAAGQATPTVNYNDAGNMRLQVQYTGSGADAGLLMTGSGEFIARPAGMCVYPDASTSCGSPYTNCTVYKKAGEPFDLITTAVMWEADGDTDFCDNTGTPNYSATGITLASNLISPTSPRDGVVTPASYDHAAGTGGANTVSITESEVGVFTFTATPPKYQGATLGSLNPADPEIAFNSQPTGRFIPDHFHVTPFTVGSLAGSCPTGNLYSGETTTWGTAPEFTFAAHNVDHGITTNYTESGYLKLTEASITSQLTVPTTDGSKNGTDSNLLALTYSPETAAFSTTANGVMSYQFNALDEFTYTRDAFAEVTSFTPDLDFSFPANLQDSDGVTIGSVLNFSPDASAVSVRFGRLWLEDSYGPETEDLIMPLRIEYFDGGGYVVNTLDDCTIWDASDATVDAFSAVQASSGMVVNGLSNGGILLQAPDDVAGTPDTGEATVTYNAPTWLQGDYDKNGTFEDPTGITTFGLNRGHERLIYRKEVR